MWLRLLSVIYFAAKTHRFPSKSKKLRINNSDLICVTVFDSGAFYVILMAMHKKSGAIIKSQLLFCFYNSITHQLKRYSLLTLAVYYCTIK